MFYLSIGAIFKNEGMVIKEWLEHHLYHGVEHFYLINDESTDDFMSILQPYINKGLITLYNNDIPKMLWKQAYAYNKFFKPILGETKWLAIIDLDEYLYSPLTLNICDILKDFENYSSVEVNWLCFGSNGYKTQPKSVVESFVKRAPVSYCQIVTVKKKNQAEYETEIWKTEGPKYIINTSFNVIGNLSVHFAEIEGEKINISWKGIPSNPLLLINHYMVMSEEYWRKVKMTRGDASCWHSDTFRDMNYFNVCDFNMEYDSRLYDQNKDVINLLSS